MPRSVRVGAMLEIPALVFQLDQLLPLTDFVSVGANDFLQFLFAGDRGNARIAPVTESLSPVFLRVVKDLAQRCGAAGVPLTVCGEMTGHPLEALALVGMGIRRLSVPPLAVGPVKTMIRTLHVESLANYLEQICQGSDDTIRGALTAYARDHAISV